MVVIKQEKYENETVQNHELLGELFNWPDVYKGQSLTQVHLFSHGKKVPPFLSFSHAKYIDFSIFRRLLRRALSKLSKRLQNDQPIQTWMSLALLSKPHSIWTKKTKMILTWSLWQENLPDLPISLLIRQMHENIFLTWSHRLKVIPHFSFATMKTQLYSWERPN